LIDERTARAITLVVLYPSDADEQVTSLGPYSMSLAPDGPLAAGVFPLVVISHGTGGSGLVYRNLASHLARRGFVVAMPEHPGNNRNDNALANAIENFEGRPRHVRIIVDWAFTSSPFAAHLARDGVAVIGHSLGGYTALAAFLSPFPPAMVNSSFPPSQDPPGFDREQFHELLNAEIVAFLDRTLRP